MSRKNSLTSLPDSQSPLSSSVIQSSAISTLPPIDWKAITISAGSFERGERPLFASSLGKVYKGIYKNESVIIKQIRSSICIPTIDGMEEKSCVEAFKREAEIMFLAGKASDRVASLKAVCFKKRYNSLIIEWMPKQSLHDLLCNGQDLPWKIRYQIAVDACSGLEELHRYKIIHGDIKSFNIALDNNLRAKWIDFGSARIEDEDKVKSRSAQVGTVSWMPPEMFDTHLGSLAADIYSFGMVLWELASRELPYSTLSYNQTLFKIMTGKTEIIPDHCPSELKGIIESCWAKEPDQRPSGAVVATKLKALHESAEQKSLTPESTSSRPSSTGLFSSTSGLSKDDPEKSTVLSGSFRGQS